MTAWLAVAALYAGSAWFRRHLRRRAELGALGALAYVAWHAVWRAALAEGLVRWTARSERWREEQRAALAAELGREPTERELIDALSGGSG